MRSQAKRGYQDYWDQDQRLARMQQWNFQASMLLIASSCRSEGVYGPFEMIAYTGARVLEDETIVFVGTGLLIISEMFAQMAHALN